MPTHIYNKKSLIEFIEKEIGDDNAIILTSELAGNVSISKKNGIKLTHQYAGDAFKDEGIGHIAFGESIPVAFIIADKKRLSEKASKIFNDIK